MPRLVDGVPLTPTGFIEQWTRLAGVNSILACAERTGIRVGIWGGCVRNFVLDDRPISDGDRSLHFIDFVDPYSDVDCVLDRADAWPLIARSISASVPLAGYHRWEFQTLDEVLSSANHYARIGAESFIVWHEGFDRAHRPKITLQSLDDTVDALLEDPFRRADVRGELVSQDPWQDLFDVLRLSRYSLQYQAETGVAGQVYFPDRLRVRNLVQTAEAQTKRTRNWLRFDLALLDLVTTARTLPEAIDYLQKLSDFLLPSFLERSHILTAIRKKYTPTLAFLGGLVYRQRNSSGLQLRVLSQGEEEVSRGGIKSIVPWTLIWSLGTGRDDCCRHEDFKNGVAVVAWRSLNPGVTYSQQQAFEFAPVAQVTRDTPYRELTEAAFASPGKVLSIPGIVRVGASVTLRFDHAYVAQFLGRNVQLSVGVVDPQTIP